MHVMKIPWRDGYYRAALLAAPIFWLIMLIAGPVPIHWSWPLARPGKFILLAAVYPTLEELVFRGLLQGTLYDHGCKRRLLPGLSLANLITSLLFALSHLPYHSWGWSLAVLVPSLIFGSFRDKYQNVAPSILLHCFFNLGYYWLFQPL